LLRVLQESEFERVGDDLTRSVDVRVIAATNRNLEELMVAGKFREDLFYRLSVFPIEVPPLRKRPEDIIQLAQHFLESICNDFGLAPLKLTRSQATVISNYDWPGNVRELKNVIERAVILSKGTTLRLDLSMPEKHSELPGAKALHDRNVEDQILTDKQMRELQKANLVTALKATNWKVSGKDGTAELLGVRPTTLYDRMKTFKIRKPGK
jgi:transcriptional regulator with GAF, ATPase, and Fis domain